MIKSSSITFVTILLIFFVYITGCASITPTQSTGGITGQSSPQIFQSSSCFKFIDVKSTELTGIPGFSVYVIEGNVTNTCMKNFENICIHATFYDNDNFVVATEGYFIPQIQHGTTVKILFNNNYQAGTGTNKPTRHQLEVSQLESRNMADC